MGLLEKAEKIQTDAPEPTPAKVEAVPEPEPVANVEPEPKKAKKSRRLGKSKKAKKAKKERVPRVIPDGFEPAGTVRASGRYLVDTTANWGVMILTAATMSQVDLDPTIPIILALALGLGNMFYLPSKFSKSTGNIITGTQFVNTRGENPMFLYHIAKSANIPIILAGLFAMLLLISEGTEWSTGNKIYVGIALSLLLIPLIDRFLRTRGDERLGFWDRLFGGVWLVTAEKTKSESGFIQRLQSIGDYAEQRGMLDEKDK